MNIYLFGLIFESRLASENWKLDFVNEKERKIHSFFQSESVKLTQNI